MSAHYSISYGILSPRHPPPNRAFETDAVQRYALHGAAQRER